MAETELPRSISSLDRMFAFLEEELRARQVDEGTTFWVKLAAEELFTNLVRHGKGSESIGLSMDVTDDQVDFRLIDYDADPFDPEWVEEVDLTRPAEEREPGGLGLPLVKSLMDEVVYEHQNGNLRVSVIKRRKS